MANRVSLTYAWVTGKGEATCRRVARANNTLKSPKDVRVRAPGAITPIVTRALFDAAQRAHKKLGEHIPTEALIERTRQLLDREGRLSIPVINADPMLLESHALARRFGGLTPLYRLVGYGQPRNSDVAAARASITMWRSTVTGFVQDWLTEAGPFVKRKGWVLRVDDAWTVSFSVPSRRRARVHAVVQPPAR